MDNEVGLSVFLLAFKIFTLEAPKLYNLFSYFIHIKEKKKKIGGGF